MTPVTPQAALVNDALRRLADAGSLPIGNMPGQVGIGIAEHFVLHRLAAKANGAVTITRAGRDHLFNLEHAA
jgi:hypothetical protein